MTLTSRDPRSGGKADLVCRITLMPKVLFG
jgi:hypothetical protein